jgi:predicted ATP-grasp superfamily ATP-dependent carboligase
MRVLILDEGRDRASVPAARALASKGWEVGTASPSPSIASRSRASARWHEVRHTGDGDDAFIESVDAVAREHGYEVVFPGWERAIGIISERRSDLSFAVGYGPHEGVLIAMDKERLSPVAAQAGLSVPRIVEGGPDAVASFDGPVVVKPGSQTLTTLPARSFDDAAEAVGYVERIAAAGGRAIVQERLSGALLAVSLVQGPAGIVTLCQQVAIHSWPPETGITARGRTIAVDDALREGIQRLLTVLQWQGIAQLQFIVPPDGVPRLIDFNPRLYGSIALAIRAGANHPDAWARVATGRDTQSAIARPGVRYQWFTRDLRASVTAPDRWRETVRCLAIGPFAAHSLWSSREPTLAPRFLLDQMGRAALHQLPSLPKASRQGARSSARLHGAEPTPALERALRPRRVPTAPERSAQRVLMKMGRLSFEEDWLEPLQAARLEAMGPAAEGPPRFLVRVDEFPYASGLDKPRYGFEASERFHDVMGEAGVPHLMAVVSQWTHDYLNPRSVGGRPLDERDQALLRRMRADGVTFAQHGTTHRTRFTNPRRHSELSGLGPDALGELLDNGRRELTDAGVETRILVPPFNRFDADRWGVLAERYDVITGGPESVRTIGFHGGPQWRDGAVYLPCYPPLYASAAASLPTVEALIDQRIGTWIPIVLHVGWEADDGYVALKRLASRLAPHAASWETFLDEVAKSRRPG